ncbi:hypothetical protein BT63DRAFT_449995 [Microthyrium microscopicum]|uniref:Uncharacterized protein n=1 Tax=Microthyrium microscopicum TaxID=703497 RepID=A0A6A6URZ2_9PEZI|nr:hypothetical protein BT63DRAFT_449995 [Microthyrium microscopicum]
MSSQRGGVPFETFSINELEERVNKLPNGKPRHPPIKLEDCELMRLVQYNCDVQGRKKEGVRQFVTCKPFWRYFRQCAGGLSVETTEWEWNRVAARELKDVTEEARKK